MTRKRRLRQKAMQALGRQIRDSGGKLPYVLIPVTMVISSLAAGHVTGSTFALSQDAVAAPMIEFQALTTSQVLRFASGRVQLVTDTAPDRVGSEVVRTFHVMNVSDRHVTLSVELTGIPWARADLSRNVLGPGETADIVVSGTPGEPGEYRGYLVVYGMGRFLELGMDFTVMVVPAPDPCLPAAQPEPFETPDGQPAQGTDPPEGAEPGAGSDEAGADADDTSAVLTGLHPDVLGLPDDGVSPPADPAQPQEQPIGLHTDLQGLPVDEVAHEEDVAAPETAEPVIVDQPATPDAGWSAPAGTGRCGDSANAQPVGECAPQVQAALAEATEDEAEHTDECASAAPPAEGEDGSERTDGLKEDDEEPAPESGAEAAEDQAGETQDDSADGETGGEPEGESDGESGEDAGAESDAGSPEGDDSADVAVDGGEDSSGDSSGTGETGETAAPDLPVADQADTAVDASESSAEDGAPAEQADLGDPGQTPAELDEADDAGAGGQTT